MRVRSLSIGLLALGVAFVLGTTSARASVVLCADAGCASVGSLGSVTVGSDGVPVWSLSGPYNPGTGYTITSWTASLDSDPFVTNNIVVTNNQATPQTFVATVLLNIPAFAYSAAINSSVGVTATDSNGDGTLSFANFGATPIYQGTVNLATVLPLNPTVIPLTLASCSPSFPGCTATSSNGTAFTPLAPGSATTIGITLTFTLSPGDSAGLTSRFEVVPEPATFGLLGAGLIGLVSFGRRRAS